jgi:adenylate cyclase
MDNQRAIGLVARARALYRQLRTPQNSLEIRALVQQALAAPAGLEPCELAETWSLLAEILMCDYLNSWNEAGAAELGQAETAVERAIDIVPGLAMAHYSGGLIYRARGHHEAALAAFARTVELKPDFALAHAQLGAEFIYTGRPLEALPQIDAAIRIAPDGPAYGMFEWYMGRALFFAGNYAEAIPHLRRSVEARANLWYNRLYLVSSLALAGDTTAAAAELCEFETAFPDFTVARVIATEQTNPNDNPVVVKARDKFHQGLLGAGMPAGAAEQGARHRGV